MLTYFTLLFSGEEIFSRIIAAFVNVLFDLEDHILFKIGLCLKYTP